MPTIRLELDTRPTETELARLHSDLAPYANVNSAAESLEITGLEGAAFYVAFFSGALQGADVLLNWIKGFFTRNPRAHKAFIRLADGRSFEIKTTDENALRAALQAVLDTP
jgi:hypothetical protein